MTPDSFFSILRDRNPLEHLNKITTTFKTLLTVV